MFVNNPFGLDELDITEESAAERVGRRIRAIRVARGLSQAELGSMVGLTADRIQKYENGVRKPKSDLLKSIAGALGVRSLALEDPTTSSYINAMFTLFELESNFNMKIEKTGEGHAPGMCLTVDFREHLYDYMKEWYEIYTQTQSELEVASSDEEREKIMESYSNWKWTFPQGLVDKNEKMLQKARIKRKIEELQDAYDKLDS